MFALWRSRWCVSSFAQVSEHALASNSNTISSLEQRLEELNRAVLWKEGERRNAAIDAEQQRGTVEVLRRQLRQWQSSEHKQQAQRQREVDEMLALLRRENEELRQRLRDRDELVDKVEQQQLVIKVLVHFFHPECTCAHACLRSPHSTRPGLAQSFGHRFASRSLTSPFLQVEARPSCGQKWAGRWCRRTPTIKSYVFVSQNQHNPH
ncbi:MAG: hypothetical protein ACPIOQ_31405 [Promethearchaeia archaeon]